jgi:hypothetical protein
VNCVFPLLAWLFGTAIDLFVFAALVVLLLCVELEETLPTINIMTRDRRISNTRQGNHSYNVFVVLLFSICHNTFLIPCTPSPASKTRRIKIKNMDNGISMAFICNSL